MRFGSTVDTEWEVFHVDWAAVLKLILEFIKLILKEDGRRYTPAQTLKVYRSARFRKWLKEQKGIEL